MKKLYHAAGKVSLRLLCPDESTDRELRHVQPFVISWGHWPRSRLLYTKYRSCTEFISMETSAGRIISAVENFSFQQHANRAVQYYCQSFDKVLCDLLWIYISAIFTLVLIFFSNLSAQRAVHLHVTRGDLKIKSEEKTGEERNVYHGRIHVDAWYRRGRIEI